MDQNKTSSMERLARVALAAGLVWAGVAVLRLLAPVLAPFAVAVVLAYICYPLVRRVQRVVRFRAAAVAVTLLGLAGVLAGLAAWLGPHLAGEFRQMAALLGDFAKNSEAAQRAAALLPEGVWAQLRDWLTSAQVQEFFRSADVLNLAKEAARQVLPGVWGVLSGALDLVLGLVGLAVVALYVVFLLLDWERAQAGWTTLVPERWRADVRMMAGDFEATMSRYFRGQVVISGLVGVLFALGFSLVGLPLAVVFGLGVGVLNLVPYLQTVALVPAALLALVHALQSGQGVWTTLGLTGLVFVVVQALQDAVLTPRVMGRALGLSPVVILLSLSIWGQLLGLLGLILALPLTVLALAWYRRLVLPRLAGGPGGDATA